MKIAILFILTLAFQAQAVVIDAMDNNQLDLNPATGAPGGYWYSYVDPYGSTVDQNTTTLEDAATWAAGNLTVNMTMVADNAPDYAFVGFGIDFADRGGAAMPAVPVDLSAWTSVTINYSSTANVTLQWVSTDDDPSDGAEHACILPSSSTQVTCLLQKGVGGFDQPSWATSRPFNKSSAIGLKFTLKAPVMAAAITVNSVSMDGGVVPSSSSTVTPSSSVVVSSSSAVVSSSSATSSSSETPAGLLDAVVEQNDFSFSLQGDLLKVTFSDVEKLEGISVVTATGKTVRSLGNLNANSATMDLAGLESGIYFLRLESNFEIYGRRLEVR